MQNDKKTYLFLFTIGFNQISFFRCYLLLC